MGMFEQAYHIEVDPSVRLATQAPRKMPYAKYEETLARLEKEGIIASIDKPANFHQVTIHRLLPQQPC